MSLRSWLLLLLLAAPLPATDLAKLRTAPSKEPAYQSGAPRYALLVFGAEPRARVWLVLDGARLFVDRNGNGDLTEVGEAIAAEPSDTRILTFAAGDVAEAGAAARHTGLHVVSFDRQGAANVAIQVAGRGEQSAGNDVHGSLTFASRPQDAPVIHFNGPLTFALTSASPLARSARPVRLNASVGTPGLGQGTFAALGHDDLAEDVGPQVEIDFADPAGKKLDPVKTALLSRC